MPVELEPSTMKPFWIPIERPLSVYANVTPTYIFPIAHSLGALDAHIYPLFIF